MATDVFVTAEADIVIKYENDPSVAWAVLNSDSTAYDFANKTDSDLNIYDYQNGSLVKNYGESATEGLSYSSNTITWNAAWPATILPSGEYYYEIVYEDSGTVNPTIKVVDGKLTVE